MGDTDDALKMMATAATKQVEHQTERDRKMELEAAATRERSQSVLDALERIAAEKPVAGSSTGAVLRLGFGGPTMGGGGGMAVAWASDATYGWWLRVVRLCKEAYGGGFVSGRDLPDIPIPYRDPLTGELGCIFARSLAAILLIAPVSVDRMDGATAMIVPV